MNEDAFVLVPNKYTFYSLFLSYCISKDFQYDVEKEMLKDPILPYPSQKDLSFLLSVMLTLCLLYTFFIKLNILSTPSLLRVFIKNGCWILSKAYAIDMINVDINNLLTNF